MNTPDTIPDRAELSECLREALAMFPIQLEAQCFVIQGGPKLQADGDDTFFSEKKVRAAIAQLHQHIKRAADSAHALAARSLAGTPGAGSDAKPYAYAIYIEAESRCDLVHDLEEAMDELTNCECVVTPLYDHPPADAAPPKAEPLKAAPDAVSDLMLELRQQFNAGREFEAERLAAQQAAKSAAASELPVAKVISYANGSYHRNYKLEWLRDVPEGTELFAAAHSAAPAAVGEHRARLLFLADCIDRNPRIEHDADDATYFRELAAFFSAPMPAGAAVGPTREQIRALAIQLEGLDVDELEDQLRAVFSIQHARMQAVGGASTPTGERL